MLHYAPFVIIMECYKILREFGNKISDICDEMCEFYDKYFLDGNKVEDWFWSDSPLGKFYDYIICGCYKDPEWYYNDNDLDWPDEATTLYWFEKANDEINKMEYEAVDLALDVLIKLMEYRFEKYSYLWKSADELPIAVFEEPILYDAIHGDSSRFIASLSEGRE